MSPTLSNMSPTPCAQQDIGLIDLLTSENHIYWSIKIIGCCKDSETQVQGMFCNINFPVIYSRANQSGSKHVLVQSSHYSSKLGYKGEKIAVVFDFISYQFTSLFACGCCCNMELKQFPGHCCSEAIATFQFLSWMCGKLQRLLRHQQKANDVSESPMHPVSPWPGNQQRGPFVPEGTRGCAGSPDSYNGHSFKGLKCGS